VLLIAKRKLKKKWIMAWQPVASNSSIIISDQVCNHGVLC
jgi:hypothetical protein